MKKFEEFTAATARTLIIGTRKEGSELFDSVLIKDGPKGYKVIFGDGKNEYELEKVARPDREGGTKYFRSLNSAISEIKRTKYKGQVVLFV